MTSAAIYGCSGPELTAAERAFFAETRPWGFILFRRNVESPDQVRALVAALRNGSGRHTGPNTRPATPIFRLRGTSTRPVIWSVRARD